jgi:hypothetical protein
MARSVSRWLSKGGPGSSPEHVMWDLWWTKRNMGRVTPSTSDSFANHSTDCFTLHHHPSSPIIRDCTISLTAADVPSGLILKTPKEITNESTFHSGPGTSELTNIRLRHGSEYSDLGLEARSLEAEQYPESSTAQRPLFRRPLSSRSLSKSHIITAM